jgi:hypothetical protein
LRFKNIYQNRFRFIFYCIPLSLHPLLREAGQQHLQPHVTQSSLRPLTNARCRCRLSRDLPCVWRARSRCTHRRSGDSRRSCRVAM